MEACPGIASLEMERGRWERGLLELEVGSARLADALARGDKGKGDSRDLLVF